MVIKNISDIVRHLDYAGGPHKCIWLVGDDNDIDFIWGMSDFTYTQDISGVENYSLFGGDSFVGANLKCIFKSDLSSFLKNSDRANWNSHVLIKGIDEVKKDIVKEQDLVLEFPVKKVPVLNIELARWFCERYGMHFDAAVMPKYARDLKDLVVLSMLQDAEIGTDHWGLFLDAAKANWYRMFKENTLLQEAVVHDQAIPVLQYAMRADGDAKRRAIMQFLLANIKDAGMVWEQNEMWKELVVA